MLAPLELMFPRVALVPAVKVMVAPSVVIESFRSLKVID